MANSEEQTVLLEKRGQIGYITWNRPEKLNAIRPQEYRLWDNAVNDCEADDNIRAVILTGSGRAWTAGDDFTFYAGTERDKLLDLDTEPDSRWVMEANLLELELHQRTPIPQCTVMTMYNSGKVWIGAINGVCWQSELLCGMDFVIAADVASFAIGDVRQGSVPGGTSTQLLPRLLGRRRAIEIILLAEEISAQDAYRMGLVTKVVPLDQLMPEAEALAKKMTNHPPIGIRFAKLAINKSFDLPIKEGLDLERNYSCLALQTEAVSNFARDFLAKKKAARDARGK